MEYKPLTDNQISLLEDSIRYDISQDANGAIGRSLANRLNEFFGENIPNTVSLDEKKLMFYNIINSVNPKILYDKLPRIKFKGIFGKLKKAGYKGPDGEGMKNYSKMDEAQMWNYFSQIKKDLDIFS